MKVHELKTWPQYFDEVASGMKPFEFRKNDRGFAVGDILLLQRFDPELSEYTGAEITAIVIYVLEGFPGIEAGYCVLGIQVSKTEQARIIPHKSPFIVI